MSFTRYNPEDSVVSSETIVRGMWKGDIAQITTFYTSSAQSTSSLKYFLDVYSTTSTSSLAFDIQFGHISGSGSTYINPDPSTANYSTSRIIYGQYRNLIYESESGSILSSTGDLMGSGSILAINLARSCFKESVKPGSLSLSLTGSSGVITLTDNSQILTTTQYIGANKYYDIVSGSIGTVFNSSIKYGYLFPDLGIILLDPIQLTGFIATLNTGVPSGVDPMNHKKLYESIKAGANFNLQSQETISSRYFFTRVRNADYNYTTNPSVIDSNGNLIFTELIDNPQTFITTVGLYNDQNELLAVAKLSRPVTKDFIKELNLRIKISY
jgi:hypothetical protein